MAGKFSGKFGVGKPVQSLAESQLMTDYPHLLSLFAWFAMAAAFTVATMFISYMSTRRKKSGTLAKLEGHRNALSPRKNRFTNKWVTCDGSKLSYYVSKDSEARKTLSIADCEVVTFQDEFLIDVVQSEEYAITFRCCDEKEFKQWSVYLKFWAKRSSKPQTPLTRLFDWASHFWA